MVAICAVRPLGEEVFVLGVGDEQKAEEHGECLLVDRVERGLVEGTGVPTRECESEARHSSLIDAVTKSRAERRAVIARGVEDLGERPVGLESVGGEEEGDVSGTIVGDEGEVCFDVSVGAALTADSYVGPSRVEAPASAIEAKRGCDAQLRSRAQARREATARSIFCRVADLLRSLRPIRASVPAIVSFARNRSIRRGSTYEARQTAGVFPSRSAACSIAWTIARSRPAFDVPGGDSASAIAASTVACQVRKSLALNSTPAISLRWVLMSSERTVTQRAFSYASRDEPPPRRRLRPE